MWTQQDLAKPKWRMEEQSLGELRLPTKKSLSGSNGTALARPVILNVVAANAVGVPLEVKK